MSSKNQVICPSPKISCSPRFWGRLGEGKCPTAAPLPKVFAYSQELRHNTTSAEQKLWNALRACQPENVHFRRQHAIGNYIVDFCAARQKLIIELDGGQHLEQEAYDQERTDFLQSKGYRVLRFWNNDVSNDLNAVVQVILDALNVHIPS